MCTHTAQNGIPNTSCGGVGGRSCPCLLPPPSAAHSDRPPCLPPPPVPLPPAAFAGVEQWLNQPAAQRRRPVHPPSACTTRHPNQPPAARIYRRPDLPSRRRDCHILLHPHPPLVGLSIVMKRGYQRNDSLVVRGYCPTYYPTDLAGLGSVTHHLGHDRWPRQRP